MTKVVKVKAKDLLKTLEKYETLNEEWLVLRCKELQSTDYLKYLPYNIIKEALDYVRGVNIVAPDTLVEVSQILASRLVELSKLKP